MFNLGTGELVLIFLILLLLFGGKRLPGIARGFANSLSVCEKIINGRLIDKIKENIN